MSPNIIQELLAKSVVKLQKQQVEQEKCEKMEGSATKTEKAQKKSKPKVNVSSENSSENLTIALVYNHMKEVTPGLAEQFGAEHEFQEMKLKLEEVVKVFNKSKKQIPPARTLLTILPDHWSSTTCWKLLLN